MYAEYPEVGRKDGLVTFILSWHMEPLKPNGHRHKGLSCCMTAGESVVNSVCNACCSSLLRAKASSYSDAVVFASSASKDSCEYVQVAPFKQGFVLQTMIWQRRPL